MPASEIPPLVEADVAEHITTGDVLIETTQGKTASFEVTITTLISAGND